MVSTVAVDQRRPTAIRRAPLLLFLLGITLNQTSVIFDINLSIADFFAFIILMLMIVTTRMVIPLGPTIYFLALSILVIIMGGFVVPNVLLIEQSYTEVLRDYTKIATSLAISCSASILSVRDKPASSCALLSSWRYSLAP